MWDFPKFSMNYLLISYWIDCQVKAILPWAACIISNTNVFREQHIQAHILKYMGGGPAGI